MEDATEKEGGIPPWPLETLQDARRAMALVLRQIRFGRVEVKVGNALIFGLTQLAHLMQDQRDTLYQKRLKKLWEAHQKALPAVSEDEPQEMQ